MEEIQKLEQQSKKLPALLKELEALGQPRSDYALKHFVVGAHDLPARQRQQVIIELQGMLFSMADVADEIRLAELDILEMQNTERKPYSSIEADRKVIEIRKKKRFIQGCQIQISGRLKECETLFAMLDAMPKCSREEFEAQEKVYWDRRLTRQYFLGMRDVGGNLAALLDTLTDPGKEKPTLPIVLQDSMKVLGLEG